MTSGHTNEGLQDDLRGVKVVLVIYDDALMKLFQLMLTRTGCAEVLVATSGPDGIRIAEAQQPDVILLNLDDGLRVSPIETIEHLHNSEQTRRIPIIAVTGQRWYMVSEVEADGFLAVPFLPSELVRTVVRVLFKARAAALKESGHNARSVPALLDALGDRRVWVRMAAAEVLGEIGKRRAVPDLINALGDQSGGVRRNAAEALGRIGDARAVPALIEALRDANGEVRLVAARALARIGRAAVPALLDALSDEDSDLRFGAAEALGEIGDRRAVPGLIHALRDEDAEVRRAAALALGRVGDARAVPTLIEVLRDADSDARSAAADALGRLGKRQAVPDLIDALGDESDRVRKSAAGALKRIGTPVALAALEEWREGRRGQS
jgi:HEAT repeat protein